MIGSAKLVEVQVDGTIEVLTGLIHSQASEIYSTLFSEVSEPVLEGFRKEVVTFKRYLIYRSKIRSLE